MLDLKFIRENPDFVKEKLASKKIPPTQIDKILSFDTERRKLIMKVEELKAKRNKLSGEVGRLKASGKASESQILEGKMISQKIVEIDRKVVGISIYIDSELYSIPNIPDNSVPIGDLSKNRIIREWGRGRAPNPPASSDHRATSWMATGDTPSARARRPAR